MGNRNTVKNLEKRFYLLSDNNANFVVNVFEDIDYYMDDFEKMKLKEKRYLRFLIDICIYDDDYICKKYQKELKFFMMYIESETKQKQ